MLLALEIVRGALCGASALGDQQSQYKECLLGQARHERDLEDQKGSGLGARLPSEGSTCAERPLRAVCLRLAPRSAFGKGVCVATGAESLTRPLLTCTRHVMALQSRSNSDSVKG